MKTSFPTFFFTLCGLFFLAAISASAADVSVGTVTIDDDVLKKAIIQVIRDDPKIVYDAYMAYQRQLAQQRDAQQLEYSFKNPAAVPVRDDNPVKGPANAPITIVCFMDYQCPYCARSVSTMSDLMEMYPGKIKLVYKNNPLPNHTAALDAAKAALAAGKQGKYWEFRDRLYADMSKLNDAGYLKLAGELGLDLPKFNADRHSDAVAATITADQKEAARLNLRSVPFFYVNGIPVKGAKSIDYFKMVIDRLLAEKTPATVKK
jgi:protein-disulfide isomerase